MRKNAPRRRLAVNKSKIAPMPDKFITKFNYSDLESYTSSFPTFTIQKAYNINGLFDAEASVGTQYPVGYKQIAQLYEKYRVFKVSYDVTLTNTSNQSVVSGSICFAQQGNGPTQTNIASLGLPYSRRFTLAPLGTAGASRRIKGSIYLPRVSGMTSEQFRTNENFVGFFTGVPGGVNPPQLLQMVITGININQGVGCFIQADVKYTCHTECYDRLNNFLTAATIRGDDPEIEA